MAERNEHSKASKGGLRPIAGAEPSELAQAELDKVAGGKRSNVGDAHDKYANADTSYDKG